jgi:hypothetical protein
MDAIEAQREEQARQDAEEEQRRIQAELDALPDPDSPAHYDPSGEMHTLSPTQPGPVTTDHGNLSGFAIPEDDTDVLPARFSVKAPPSAGTYPPQSELAHPETPPQRQPIAVSMMSEDNE